MTLTDHIDTGIKHFMDWLSLSAALGSIMGWLPEIGAFLPIVWYGIKIYETDTIQKLLGRKGASDDYDLHE